MILKSILNKMDDEEEIKVIDENAPINKMLLFSGSVQDCKKQKYFRNGLVTFLCADENIMHVGVDIEYQKQCGLRKAVKGDGLY